MWRIGVLLVATVLIEFAAAGVKPTDGLLMQRLKRSPYSCDSYDDYQRRPRNWPPPPPPAPFWPPPPGPPPPAPFWPPPPGPPPYWRRHHHDHQFEDLSDAISRGEEPCSNCAGGKGASTSLSNAKSENGDAIAVAIAKASPKT